MEYRLNACPCSVYTFNQAIASTRLNHNYSGDSRKIWVSKVAAELRKDAATSLEPTQSMVEKAIRLVPSVVHPLLPIVGSLKRAFQKARQKAYGTEKESDILSELQIPERFKFFEENDENIPFLLYDFGAFDDRILIFGLMRHVELLKNNKDWYDDGIFSVSPKLFSQIYTVHVIINNQHLPIMYALLPNKTKIT